MSDIIVYLLRWHTIGEVLLLSQGMLYIGLCCQGLLKIKRAIYVLTVRDKHFGQFASEHYM